MTFNRARKKRWNSTKLLSEMRATRMNTQNKNMATIDRSTYTAYYPEMDYFKCSLEKVGSHRMLHFLYLEVELHEDKCTGDDPISPWTLFCSM